jgi:hypothetical protein
MSSVRLAVGTTQIGMPIFVSVLAWYIVGRPAAYLDAALCVGREDGLPAIQDVQQNGWKYYLAMIRSLIFH